MNNKMQRFSGLYKSCFLSSVFYMFYIPISIMNANLISRASTSAVDGNISDVLFSVLFVFVLLLISTALKIFGKIKIDQANENTLNNCKTGFLKLLFANPVNKLFNCEKGELIESINDDIASYSNRYIRLYPELFSSIVVVLSYLIFLAVENPIISVILLGISLIQIIPPIIVNRHFKITYDECRDIEAKLTDKVVEAVNGFDTIKMNGIRTWWTRKLLLLHKDYYSIGRHTDTVAATQRSIYKLLDSILKYGTYALLGIFAIKGFCSFNGAIQAIYLSSSLYNAVKTLFSSIPNFSISHVAEKRLCHWLYRESTSHVEINSNCIIIKDVDYKVNNLFILEKSNYIFNIEKNYLIIGKNGAGKTTLLNMLCGFIVPTAGEIIVNENSSYTLYKENKNGSIFIIPQDDPLYNFECSYLLKMFEVQIKKDINYYFDIFDLHIDKLLNTKVKDLSGGERKKLFLSIGFAVCPDWLFLDEPSNNLDENGKKALKELMTNRKGILVVSHEIELLSHFDVVLDVSEGHLNEK